MSNIFFFFFSVSHSAANCHLSDVFFLFLFCFLGLRRLIWADRKGEKRESTIVHSAAPQTPQTLRLASYHSTSVFILLCHLTITLTLSLSHALSSCSHSLHLSPVSIKFFQTLQKHIFFLSACFYHFIFSTATFTVSYCRRTRTTHTLKYYHVSFFFSFFQPTLCSLLSF